MPETANVTSAHFIGIGGAGMSGIALVLHERGCRVTGSDLKSSHYVRELEAVGIDVRVGHDAATIDAVSPQVVVTSTAIPETNPEVVRARELGIPIWPRAKMLSYLSGASTTVAVAGTHGKTTTSSMVATMLDKMGLDPSFLIGGVVEGYDTNGRNGSGEHFVCEADESDGSFLYLHPNVVVVTNIEADHLDHYGTLENIEKTFCTFMGLVGDAGTVIVNGDVARYVELARSTGRRVLTYGFDPSCDYVCLPEAPTHALASNFSVRLPGGEKTVRVTISANPGRHNMANATAAIAVADALGLDADAAATALSQFKGARRRFTHVGDVAGVTVVDDYGHHPTEVRATLAAASELPFKRIVCVFQPHRYSRTQALAAEFGTAFDQADVLRVMDVFGAGEMPIPGVSGKTVVESVRHTGNVADVVYVPNRRHLIENLCDLVRPGDLLITQGAGDVTSVGPAFIKAMNERAAAEKGSCR
ncbi:UDP-N-acetylmuramate--L-alanine ligase [Olsenella sp. DSM 107455]|uniref:UDP-N-acetylmuramate--L-alanine ligase n=1 Tax=Thermophilibacter gallinarum TaxID=2779357 RepID=A0ABR9QS81_9ACTN|nr:UDP-N-acetylmuramate--L-alanine ligase [Thermophilibacter gallinarum]MBE5023950.1 UDP-N-acetylmuramate--L-alanine ligase [Thermophilibacter gallinarum]